MTLDPAVKFKWNWCIPSRVIDLKIKVRRRGQRQRRRRSHDPDVSSLLSRRHKNGHESQDARNTLILLQYQENLTNS